MSAVAEILNAHDERGGVLRWTLSAAVVLTAYAGIATAFQLWDRSETRPPESPAVMIELADMPEAPSSEHDAAPGPEMAEAPPPPEPAAPVEREPLPPPDPIEPLPETTQTAEVLLPKPPPEPPQVKPPEEPKEVPPEPVKPIEVKKPPEDKLPPKDEIVEAPLPPVKPPEPVKVETRKPPAPRTTAAPRSSQKSASVARAPSPGVTASPGEIATWRDQVLSRLQRAKRYPSSSESRREQGVVTLNFTVNRNGGVTARRIARSSGHPALDQEVLEMVSRAAPFPAFPAGMAQTSVNLSVPIRFSLR